MCLTSFCLGFIVCFQCSLASLHWLWLAWCLPARRLPLLYRTSWTYSNAFRLHRENLSQNKTLLLLSGLFIGLVCMRVYVFTHATARVYRSEATLQQSFHMVTFDHVGSRDRTRATRLGGNVYLPSYLPGPSSLALVNKTQLSSVLRWICHLPFRVYCDLLHESVSEWRGDTLCSFLVCADNNHVRTWTVTRFRGMISTQPGSTPLASFKILSLEETESHGSYSSGNDIGRHLQRGRSRTWGIMGIIHVKQSCF